jgi:hypothetical protein
MTSKFSEDIQKEVFELTRALYRVTDFFPKHEVLRRSLREKAIEIFSMVTQYTYASIGGEALQIFARIEAIKGYLEIAKTMRFVKPINLAVLHREYEFLGEYFKNESRLSDMRNTPPWTGNQMSDMKGASSYPVKEYTSHKRSNEGVKFEVGRETNFSSHNQKPPSALKNERPIKEAVSKPSIGQKESGTMTDRQRMIIDHLKKGDRKAKLGDLHSLFGNVSSKTIQRDLHDLVSRNILRKEGEKRWTTYFLVV